MHVVMLKEIVSSHPVEVFGVVYP